jgi:hypothetical protein
MVDVFVDRVELMQTDESPELHQKNRQAEYDAVEKDRASPAGLFRGIFSKRPLKRLQYNEEDRIYRCASCSHEYVGGRTCDNCGLDFHGDEEGIDLEMDLDSDVDDSELDMDEYGYGHFHAELDLETDEDEAEMDEDVDHEMQHWGPGQYHVQMTLDPFMPSGFRFSTAHTSSSGDSEDDDDDDEAGSLEDFISDDEGPVRTHDRDPSSSHESDSHESYETVESDEEGNLTSVRRTRPRAGGRRRSSPVPTATDASGVTSDAGDADVAERLQASGWSPLHQEPNNEHDSDSQSDESDSSDDSDSTVGHRVVVNDDNDDDDEDDEDEDVQPPRQRRFRGQGQSIPSSSSDDESDSAGSDSEDQDEPSTDLEGDVEMSLSPVSGRRGNGRANGRGRGQAENLGPVNTIHAYDEDSSDDTVQPTRRRGSRSRAPRYFEASPQGHFLGSDFDVIAAQYRRIAAQYSRLIGEDAVPQDPYFNPPPAPAYPSRFRGVTHRRDSFHGSSSSGFSNRPRRGQRHYH